MAVRYKVFPYWIKTVVKLENLCVVKYNDKRLSWYEHMSLDLPKWAQHMRVLGEAGTVTVKTKMHLAFYNKGMICMFLGYAENHDGDCYQMWHESTSRCFETRDVMFLHRMHYQREQTANELTIEPMILSISADEAILSIPADKAATDSQTTSEDNNTKSTESEECKEDEQSNNEENIFENEE